MKALKKPMNHPHPIDSMDLQRVQAVVNGKLNAKWVSTDEIDAVRDMMFDHIAAEKQTHLGSLVLQ
jgi:hypothetical protein